MLRSVIIDDEESAVDELQYQLNCIDYVEVVATYTDGIKACDEIDQLNVDVVFLDIEMPEITGVELARKLLKKDTSISIVFITAYPDYAIDAYDIGAVHYLLKPIKQEKLIQALERITHTNETDDSLQIINDYNAEAGKIIIKNKDTITLIKIKDIIYIESNPSGTEITTNREKLFTTSRIKYWEENLCKLGFIRCHRSYIVNMEHVYRLIRLVGDNYDLELDGQSATIPTSRHKLTEVKKYLNIK